MKNHGGLITVTSIPGKETMFTLYLPVAEESPQCQRSVSENPFGAGEGKILLMDDEETVVRVASQMLGFMGYEVTIAVDGEEVLAFYRKAQRENRPFAVVILDLTIAGGMGGKETMEKLLAIDPNVKAVVSSGYANDPVMADFKSFGFSGVVAKPYTMRNLGEVLRNILE